MANREIIDAKYKLVRPARAGGLPWWRRLYFDRTTLVITVALAVGAFVKAIIAPGGN